MSNGGVVVVVVVLLLVAAVVVVELEWLVRRVKSERGKAKS